jgi:hypothetical protein
VIDMRGSLVTEAVFDAVQRMVDAGEARAVQGGAALALQQSAYLRDRRLG